jgi:hypothetical protein
LGSAENVLRDLDQRCRDGGGYAALSDGEEHERLASFLQAWKSQGGRAYAFEDAIHVIAPNPRFLAVLRQILCTGESVSVQEFNEACISERVGVPPETILEQFSRALAEPFFRVESGQIHASAKLDPAALLSEASYAVYQCLAKSPSRIVPSNVIMDAVAAAGFSKLAGVNYLRLPFTGSVRGAAYHYLRTRPPSESEAEAFRQLRRKRGNGSRLPRCRVEGRGVYLLQSLRSTTVSAYPAEAAPLLARESFTIVAPEVKGAVSFSKHCFWGYAKAQRLFAGPRDTQALFRFDLDAKTVSIVYGNDSLALPESHAA